MKAVLRGKFIALSAYRKKVDRSHTNDLIVHLKVLEQKETDILRRSRQQEIFKLRTEISKPETNNNKKKQYKEPMKQRVGSLRKISKIGKFLSKLI